MQNFEVLAYSIVQGITEFIPVSSSAHLYVMEFFFNWKVEGLIYALAAHLGTLLAVLFVEKKTIYLIFNKFFIKKKVDKKVLPILVCIFPVIIAGLFIVIFFKEIYTFSITTIALASIFGAVFGLFLGILIAIVVLFNTLIINLSERDREIATLRVLGAPMNRLGWMMFGEHLAIGLIGGILAFVFTLVGTQAMVSSFVQWSFYMTVSADPVVAMQLIGIVVFISVILTPYGMRRIRKMDLVEKVKDLSQ